MSLPIAQSATALPDSRNTWRPPDALMLKILKAESGRGLLRVNASLGQRNREHRAVQEWSHSLLTTEQQTVFRRLGVMSGSFDMSAAQQICAELDAGEWEVLGRLAALVDKSLVVADSRPGAEPRFHLLETMRHFALDRLNAAAEETLLRERHLAHFLKLAESAGEPLGGSQQGEWLKRLDHPRRGRRATRRRQQPECSCQRRHGCADAART